MKRTNDRARKRLTIILLLCIVSLGLIARGFVERVETLLVEQTEEVMQEMATQGANMIQEELEEELALLEILANQITAVKDASLEEILYPITRLYESTEEMGTGQFRQISLITPEGKIYLRGGKVEQVEDMSYLEPVWQGERIVSDLMTDEMTDKSIVVYALPMREEGEVKGILTAVYDVDYLLKNVSQGFFEGKSEIYILDENYEIQYTSHSAQAVGKQGHISWHQANGESHEVNGSYSAICKPYLDALGGEYYAIARIDEPQWYILYSLPEHIVAANADEILYILGHRALLITVVLTLVLGYILSSTYLSKKRTYELAYISPLTQLYNSNKFIKEAEVRLAKNDKKHTLIIFDVDNIVAYKEIFGIEFGDTLIQAIANKLKKLLAKQHILYAHLGLDRFGVLLPSGEEDVVMKIVQLLEQKMEKIQIPGYPSLHIILSVGVYPIPCSSTTIHSAINKADIARERVRGHHDKRHQIFEEKDMQDLKELSEIGAGILTALEEKQFRIHYQPKVDVATGQIAGAEALIRWEHPTQGMISPGKFIPIAEANRSIIEISKYVIRQVCEDLRSWEEQGLKRVPIAINLSKIEMYSPGILKYLRDTLKTYEVSPQWIELEITERIAIEDLDRAKMMISAFKTMGFTVAMDDFGAGYSGAGYIKHLPFDTIKIDKVLVDDIDQDDKSAQILLGMVNTIQSLGLAIVAEGVENQQQVEIIKAMGVEYIQGYVFARPMEKDAFERKIKEN